MASAAGAVAIITDIASLEPVAFQLVLALVQQLKGKSDAEVLAADSAGWGDIVAKAHAAQNLSAT